MLELDQDEISKGKASPTQRFLRRSLQNRQINAYDGVIGKGIISSYHHTANIDSNGHAPTSTEPLGKMATEKEAVGSSPRRQKREKAQTSLLPLAQTISTIVYSNVTSAAQAPPDVLSRSDPRTAVRQDITQTSLRNFSLSRSVNRIVFHEDTDEEQNEPQSKPAVSSLMQGISNPPLLFELESHFESNKPIESNCQFTKPKEEVFINLPKNRTTPHLAFNDSSEQEDETAKESPPAEPRVIYRSDLLNGNLAEKKKQMSEDIPQNTTLQMVLQRNKDGFNSFWPEFYLKFESEDIVLLAAKKVSSKPAATFVLSSNANNFTENSSCYLGKLKSNLFGDVINLFGIGLNPGEAKDRNCIPRELLATIVFTSTAINKPREFQVFVRKPEYRYYLNFHQVAMYGEEVPLNELYKFHENRTKIDKYSNRKPVFSEEDGAYTLNFGGKAECRSIKNFILESQTGSNVIVFGKVNDEKFNLLMSHPLSALVGMAVALTSFDSRLLFSE